MPPRLPGQCRRGGDWARPYRCSAMPPSGTKVIPTNRQARRDYEILETVEAGLVLKGSEVKSRVDQDRLALVPLALYFKDGRVKVELGLAKGRKRYDKRQMLAKRDADL